MSRIHQVYRHSGTVPLEGVLLMAIYGGVGAAAAGILSAWLYIYSPVVSVLFALLQGFLVGWAVKVAGKQGKVRSTAGLFIAGACAGAASAAIAFFVSRHFLAQAARPGGGPFAVDIDPNILWGAAAPLILAVAGYLPAGVLGSLPFCEQCNAWIDRQTDYSFASGPGDPEATWQQLAGGDFSVLRRLGPATGDSAAVWKTLARECPTCDGPAYVTVKYRQTVGTIKHCGPVSGRGEKRRIEEIDCVENLAVDRQTLRALTT